MVKITASEKRIPTPQQVAIGENITLKTWGAVKVNKSHFFPSSFQLKTDDKVIYIDPVEVGNTEPADFILITHAHPDHFSIKDIKNLLKEETTIICSKGVSKKLKNIRNKMLIVSPNKQLYFDGLSIETTLAYNTKPVFLWIKAHPKSKENVGYVLTLENEIKIYHAGDTDYIPEMKELNDIDVALTPIGGDNLTMNEVEAAKIINEIKPKIVIPMHFEIKNRLELNRFEALVNEKTRVIILE
jgi:L-ascorbate metabolism protein UlaG (beta-lactamase superfamily)